MPKPFDEGTIVIRRLDYCPDCRRWAELFPARQIDDPTLRCADCTERAIRRFARWLDAMLPRFAAYRGAVERGLYSDFPRRQDGERVGR